MPSPQKHEETLFALALEKPADKRADFLDGACHNNPALRQRLEALLAAHDAVDGELAKPAAAKATIKLDLADAPDEAVGQMLGRYKLMERVGEGGCGVVYVAEQTEPVRRRVALKVIKLGMDTKAVVARFEAERQALAMMDHPNIAKVLDAGTTEQGRPFFVMELVRGIRITDYCDQNQLSTHERLDLFIKVCQAIQHAHQKGIIHRDIKPSNILVTLHDGVPVPKVIDFGIAKATEGRLTDATVYTQLHQFIGTPAYMSPEQAEMSGLDIDTRSDIYSLGVLLYELLAGSTPFDAQELMSQGIDAMRKTIREQEPVRPSTRFATLKGEELTTTAKRRSSETSTLMRELKGDLDWIVMKCLEKDRTRRYDTATGLAADIKRHLNNEPVVARPPSTAYRFQKAFRRNKISFAAGAIVIGALLLGIVATTWQSVRANRSKHEALAAQAQAIAAQVEESKQRQQADTARTQAEGLVTFMMEDLQPSLRRYGRLPLLKQVVERAIQYFDGLPPELRDLKTELGRADCMEARANILWTSGDIPAAKADFEKSLVIYRSLLEKHPDNVEALAMALHIEQELTELDGSSSSAELDDLQQSRIRRWRELYRRYPDNILVVRGLIGILSYRCILAASTYNKPEEAIAAGLEAETITRARIARFTDTIGLRIGLAQNQTALATAYEATGQRDKAVQLSEEAVAYFDKVMKDDPGNLFLMAEAAEAARYLSYRVSAISLKRARDAELVARELYRRLTALDPSNADWRYSFATTHMMECYYLEGDGQIEAARQAIQKFDSLLEREGVRFWDADKPMGNSIELARLAAMAGDSADAHAQLATGEARFQARYDKLPAGSYDRIQARIRWLSMECRVYDAMHDWVELERVARESLTAIAQGLGQRPGDSELLLRRAVAQGFQGIALLHHGNASAAVAMLQQSAAGHRETPVANAFKEDRESFAIMTTEALAEALAMTGDVGQARSLCEATLDTQQARLAAQPDSWELKEALADGLVQLASLLDTAKPAEAARRQSLLNQAAAILNSPESQGRLTVDGKETLARIASLRGSVETKKKPEIQQP